MRVTLSPQQLDLAEKTIRAFSAWPKNAQMAWFDALAPLHRAFINEYGVPDFIVWRASHASLQAFELELRRRYRLPAETPIYTNYIRGVYGR